MAQYISKSAVMAEIERRKRTWQHQDQQYVNGGKDVCDYLLGFLDTLEVKEVQEEPVSEDLEEAARKIGQKYFPNENNIWARPNYEAMAAANAFKEGAEWQKEQCQKTIELAEDHAMLAGMEKMKEELIGKACKWLRRTQPQEILPDTTIERFKLEMEE